MNFILKQTSYSNSEIEAKRLSELGFKFERSTDKELIKWERPMIDISEKLYISINSIEELIAFVEKYGEIVIAEDTIEIYNDYRE